MKQAPVLLTTKTTVNKKMDTLRFNIIWLLVILSIRMTLNHIDHFVSYQVNEKKVKKRTRAPKHSRHFRYPKKYVCLILEANWAPRTSMKEYLYKLCKYIENGPGIYGRSQNYYCYAIPIMPYPLEYSGRMVIRLGATRLDNNTPEVQDNREEHIEDLLRIRNMTGQQIWFNSRTDSSLHTDNNGARENPENGACGESLPGHPLSFSESNISSLPGLPSIPSSELPSPKSNGIWSELNNSSSEEQTSACSAENRRTNGDLKTTQHAEETPEPTTALILHSDQDNGDCSRCHFCGGKLRNGGIPDDTPEHRGGARQALDREMISIKERRFNKKGTKNKKKTSECKNTAEPSNTQTGAAMQLPTNGSLGGDEFNATALSAIFDVNIREKEGPCRIFRENENRSVRNTKFKSNPPTTTKERRFNEKGIKDEVRMANHASPEETESENVEGRQVDSIELQISIRESAMEPISDAPSDNIDQRMTDERELSRSLSDNNANDVIKAMKDEE